MTIYRGPGGTGSATSDADTNLYQQFLEQSLAARDAALAAQTAAELAETNAETAETNAETAESNAETAATNAASSASAAATSASNASSSASAAASSASSASTSATNAANSATAAASSAASAANSASTATTQASNASSSATAAASSASSAATSATNAASSASSASTSATNAANSATSASNSASSAATSATNAANSATSASNSATAAAASASEAAGYAASINPADLVHISGTETITGAKTFSTNPTLSAGTANGVAYLNGSKVLTTGSALTFDGSNLTVPANVQSGGNPVFYSYNGGAAGTVRAGIQMVGTDPSVRFTVNNTEGMRLTSTGLGIGTTSPGEKLTVSGNIAFPWANSGTYAFGPQVASSNAYVLSGVTLEIKGADAFAGANAMAGGDVLIRGGVGQPNVGLGVFSGDITLRAGATTSASDVGAGVIKFETGGTSAERMRIDSSGNLGLGVTPSAWGSTYKAFDLNTFGGVASTTAGMRVLGNTYFNGTSWIYKTTAEATRYDQASGIHTWYNAPSGTAGNAISFTQAMTLNASGFLGIGTTSPASALHVSGGTNFSITSDRTDNTLDGSQTHLSLRRGTGAGNVAQINSIGGGSNDVKAMAFAIGGTERARIDSSGNLLVGTTSPDFSPKLAVTTGAQDAATIKFNGNYTGIHLVNASNTSYTAMKFWNNNVSGTVGTISCSTSATSYNTSSDYRLKENIQPMQDALAKVVALKPCTYTWKVDGSSGEGFIAHELAEVVPQCVTGEKDAVDAEGKPVYQGIDTSFLVATLTAAIQEQQAIIQSLTARVAALEAA